MSYLVAGMGYLLQMLYQITSDYGLAIVGLTLLIKTVLIPVDLHRQKFQTKQREMNREMDLLRKKYSRNPKKLEMETQKLMQRQGGTFSGCLTVLLPFPVMLCLFRVIQRRLSEELTSCLLPWVPSLLVRDPYGVLAILTVIVQMGPQFFGYLPVFKRLDLPQAPILTVLSMAAVSGFVSFSLPSGVVLYYLVSSVFSMIEQTVFLILELSHS